MRYTMNNDKSRDAAPEQKRGCQECPAQRASGIEPAMAAKGNRDVSLLLGGLPTAEAAPDLQDHRHLKQAAASRGGNASRGKKLSQQQ